MDINGVMHVIFSLLIRHKSCKISRTLETFAYESYVHGTLFLIFLTKDVKSTLFWYLTVTGRRDAFSDSLVLEIQMNEQNENTSE